MLNPPTLLYKASNLNLQIYLVFHHAEFTRFHYSLTVHTFCCTSPIQKRMTGITRYTALWCPDFPLLKKSNKTACLCKFIIYFKYFKHTFYYFYLLEVGFIIFLTSIPLFILYRTKFLFQQ